MGLLAACAVVCSATHVRCQTTQRPQPALVAPAPCPPVLQRFLKYALMKLPMLLLLASSSPRYGDIMQASALGRAAGQATVVW